MGILLACVFAILLGSIQCKPDRPKQFRIALVADQDKNSRLDDETWRSWLKTGTLTLDANGVSIEWDENMTELTTHDSESLRGAELSELIVFNGKLYTVGDKIGIVFEILDGRLVPWVILEDGDGTIDDGFKGEWMTIKDGNLYVGSHGVEFVSTEGEVLNTYRRYVKVISPDGAVQHVDWNSRYVELMAAVGLESPGYLTHEAACWSDIQKLWFFLPRKASETIYDEVLDETRGTNYLLGANENFSKVYSTTLGEVEPERGFSAFRFIPGTRDSVLVALKTTEVGDKIASYIVAYDNNGVALMEETQISDSVKFEGLEFI